MQKGNQGFVKLIVLIVCIIIVVSLLGINLRTITSKKDLIKDNFSFVWEKAKETWASIKRYINNVFSSKIIMSENVYCASFNTLRLPVSPL